MLPSGASTPVPEVTTGDASVRPYPSCRPRSKRWRIAWRTSGSSLAAPEVARRTLANASAGAPGSVAHALHMVGTPLMTVTP